MHEGACVALEGQLDRLAFAYVVQVAEDHADEVPAGALAAVVEGRGATAAALAGV